MERGGEEGGRRGEGGGKKGVRKGGGGVRRVEGGGRRGGRKESVMCSGTSDTLGSEEGILISEVS